MHLLKRWLIKEDIRNFNLKWHFFVCRALIHSLSPSKGPVENIFNFIQSPLSILWICSIVIFRGVHFRSHFYHFLRKSKYAGRILNKIVKALNKTLSRWNSMLQGFQIYFAWNPGLKGINPPTRQCSRCSLDQVKSGCIACIA